MITKASIKNYKSISDLDLELGRVTVLIGENGSGKTNILEAFALASAAAGNKLDQEFLVSRGIRVTEPSFMRAAFAEGTEREDITLTAEGMERFVYVCLLHPQSEAGYLKWLKIHESSAPIGDDLHAILQRVDSINNPPFTEQTLKEWRDLVEDYLSENAARLARSPLASFLVYSPENTVLRTFQGEGQILPLGIKGEGLFKLLKVLRTEEGGAGLAEIRENLRLIDWFEDLRIAADLAPFEQTLQIQDRYLKSDLSYFDQRSANEGFLFLLFYFALFVSPQTPSFFAIDNIDASLNPKLCSELVRRLTVLAKKHGKQVIMTTHNPAVLDGLDLHDEEQRLLVTYRNSKGHTRVRRVEAPQPVAGEPPVRLSEAFLRGILGGLPQNF